MLTGAGALCAHAWSGGEVTAPAALLSVGLSAVLGPVVLGRGLDAARTGAVALLAQAVWHVVYMLTSPASAMSDGHASAGSVGMSAHEHAGTAVPMLLTHAGAAVVSLLLALGAERALLSVLLKLTAALVPRPAPQRAFALLGPRPVPTRHDVLPKLAARTTTVRVLRGPPSRGVVALAG